MRCFRRHSGCTIGRFPFQLQGCAIGPFFRRVNPNWVEFLSIFDWRQGLRYHFVIVLEYSCTVSASLSPGQPFFCLEIKEGGVGLFLIYEADRCLDYNL